MQALLQHSKTLVTPLSGTLISLLLLSKIYTPFYTLPLSGTLIPFFSVTFSHLSCLYTLLHPSPKWDTDTLLLSNLFTFILHLSCLYTIYQHLKLVSLTTPLNYECLFAYLTTPLISICKQFFYQ